LNIFFIISATIVFAISLAHTILGERFIINRLVAMDLFRLFGSEAFVKRTIRMAWHLTTVSWWGFSAMQVYWATVELTRQVFVAGIILIVVYGTMSLFSIVVVKGRHWISWVGFLIAAVFTALGIFL
jgi:hypothetical protein